MITNGLNIDNVLPALQQRIGWSQSTIAAAPVIIAGNLVANSGRYYQDFHPAVTVAVIKAIQENPAITDAQLNALLIQYDTTVAIRAINAIFNKQQLIERYMCFNRFYNMLTIPVPNGGNFVGYRINVAPGNYATHIGVFTLFFNAVATFNVYLFNDLDSAPIQTKSVTTVANNQKVVTVDWLLNYTSSTIKGGVWYIGYFQDDVVASNPAATAIDEQYTKLANAKIFGIYPFQSPKTGSLDFNRTNPGIVFRSYGMNVEISSYRDYSETIIQNAHLFDEARGLLMAIYVIEQITNSTRENYTAGQSRFNMDSLKADINTAFPTDDYPRVAGLKAQLEREFKRINDNFNPKIYARSVSIGNDHGFAEYQGYNIFELPSRENPK